MGAYDAVPNRAGASRLGSDNDSGAPKVSDNNYQTNLNRATVLENNYPGSSTPILTAKQLLDKPDKKPIPEPVKIENNWMDKDELGDSNSDKRGSTRNNDLAYAAVPNRNKGRTLVDFYHSDPIESDYSHSAYIRDTYNSRTGGGTGFHKGDIQRLSKGAKAYETALDVRNYGTLPEGFERKIIN